MEPQNAIEELFGDFYRLCGRKNTTKASYMRKRKCAKCGKQITSDGLMLCSHCERQNAKTGRFMRVQDAWV